MARQKTRRSIVVIAQAFVGMSGILQRRDFSPFGDPSTSRTLGGRIQFDVLANRSCFAVAALKHFTSSGLQDDFLQPSILKADIPTARWVVRG